MVFLELNLPAIEVNNAPYIWKLNNSLLKDKEICKDFRLIWIDWQEEKQYLDIHSWWEKGKKIIKNFFLIRGAIKARTNRAKDANNNTELEKLGKIPNPSKETLRKIEQLNNDQYNREMEKLEGLKIRARVTETEAGETSSAYFFSKHKELIRNKTIKALKDTNGNIETGQGKLEIVQNHFRETYESSNNEITSEQMDTFLKNIHPKIEQEISRGFGEFVTSEEAYEALNLMKPNKSPGPDGITKEFYRAFWDVIGQDLIDVYNNAFRRGILPPTLRQANITLIYKKKRPTINI